MRRLISLATSGLTCALLLAGAPEVMAQQFTGGLRGAVKDANGVIPGVEVTLLNEGTAVTRDDFATSRVIGQL